VSRDFTIQKLNTIIKSIENLYVDTIDSSKLIENVISSLFQKLDPYSNYMNSEEAKDMNNFLQGNFDGIGIQFSPLVNSLYVVQVIHGSPSEKVGIMAGDRIIAINDTLISEMRDVNVAKQMRCHNSPTINLKIMRRNNCDPITFKIIRDKVPISSLDAFYMINKKTGYVKLTSFASTTYNEFKIILKNLQLNGLKNLILDLQDNGGGYLQSAIDIASQFLKKNDLIVYTKGFHQKQKNIYTQIDGSFLNGKIIVLINETTASSSEIVAGALQDWDRAVIVGRKSFGKGLVQCPVFFLDGSMIKLTTARYYTPTGRFIQKKYDNRKFCNKDSINCYNSIWRSHLDSTYFDNLVKYSTLLNKRVVYGGGGIMPDCSISTDTSQHADIYNYIFTSKNFNECIADYIDKYRNFIRKNYNINTYKSQFNVSNTLLNSLFEKFQKEKFEMLNNKNFLSYNSFNGSNRVKNKKKIILDLLSTEYMIKQFKKSKFLIKLKIKALIARNIWGMNGYYKIINDKNDALKKAIEIMNNNEMYDKLLGK
jgi:carboxyl-terminal processing protease